jgi:hypothetical protein
MSIYTKLTVCETRTYNVLSTLAAYIELLYQTGKSPFIENVHLFVTRVSLIHSTAVFAVDDVLVNFSGLDY